VTPPDLGIILYTAAFALAGIGILGIVISTHLVRIVLSIVLLETGANLLLMLVDPVPQALVLTAIVIGVAVQAFMMTLVLRLRRVYGTLDIRELRDLLERDLAHEAGIRLPGSEDAPLPATENPAVAREGGA
jgi:multisubunit Na+/H+ antiporter MnhC subunit